MELKSKNLEIFNLVRNVPEQFTSKFVKYNKEMTNINAMWRIEKLTELFGPCGSGWYINIVKQDIHEFSNGTALVQIQIELIFKNEAKAWSKPIVGIGTSWIKYIDQAGVLIADDDAFKKAYTDSIAIACKSLGFGADIWYQRNESKYDVQSQESEVKQEVKEQVNEKENEVKKDAKEQVQEETKKEKTPLRGVFVKQELTPKSEIWGRFVTWSAKKTYIDNKKLRMEIEQKWKISDENFEKLMIESGRIKK